MDTVAMHAAKIGGAFPGFQSGINAIHRDNSDKRVVIMTVFNRVVNEDSGLRFKVLIPVSSTDCVDGRLNLLGSSVETLVESSEIVITTVGTYCFNEQAMDIYSQLDPFQEHYTRPFTVKDVCDGMLFDTDTVLEGRECCILAGSLPVDTVGMYLMSYYVTEFRIMYNTSDDTNSVYRRHPPIFENICGVIPVNMHVSQKQLICVHGNIAFKGCNAIFKGVRDVHAIKVF
jgi:hypothetical protein